MASDIPTNIKACPIKVTNTLHRNGDYSCAHAFFLQPPLRGHERLHHAGGVPDQEAQRYHRLVDNGKTLSGIKT